MVDEYRDKMIVSLQFRRTQRHGGVSYVLDLLERVELLGRVSILHLDAAALIALAGLKASEPPIGAEEQLNRLFKQFLRLRSLSSRSPGPNGQKGQGTPARETSSGAPYPGNAETFNFGRVRFV